MSKDNLDSLLAKANNLPLLPGVYIMKDEKSAVIYVGKAKKLKNRVSSYFHGEHLPKVAAMVEKVHDFDVIIASSEFEALILENSLIKRHKPHYNILLKDDKGYPFIRLDTASPYPRLSVVGKQAEDGAQYFGPYGSRGRTFEIVTSVNRALGLPDCSRRFPRDIGRERPCLNYHLNNCAGWCLPERTAQEYADTTRKAILLLQGKCDELLATLKEEMQKAAAELRFEQAAAIRDRIKAIEQLENRQRVISLSVPDTDVIGFYRGAGTCFTVTHYVCGSLASKDTEVMDDPIGSDDEIVADFICAYYSSGNNTLPRTILSSVEPDGAEDISRMLTAEAGHKVSIECPKRGERVRLVQSATLNAFEELQRRTTDDQRRSSTLDILKGMLALDSYPARIESFDISNLGSDGIVASMVVYENGKPCRKDYRKFHIRGLENPDDYASMRQAVYRRYRHTVEGDTSFPQLPGLLLIDGGDRHAAEAEAALSELGITLPVFGMVKDDHHRTRALVTSGGEEIGIKTNQAVYALIGSIQEETHRTAITFQRSTRKSALGSSLDEITGVGPGRRNALLKHFGTVSAVRNATVEQLSAVVPKNVAESIYTHFKSKAAGTAENEEKTECE